MRHLLSYWKRFPRAAWKMSRIEGAKWWEASLAVFLGTLIFPFLFYSESSDATRKTIDLLSPPTS